MRSRRLDPEHGIHHVYSRGTRLWIMFLDDHDRRQFLRRLATVCARYGIEVFAFCLMDNHFHLVVYCRNKQLSEMQRDLKSLHARLYNDRHRFSGPVFEGRFRSKLVVTDQNLRNLVRYVHRNPYAIDPSMRLGNYEWSSHANYLGERVCPPWLNVRYPFALFGNDVDAYKFEIETPYEGDQVRNLFDPTAPPRASTTGRPPWQELGLDEILVAVAHAADAELTEVRPDRRNGLIGIALLLAVDVACYLPSEVVSPFGYRTTAAVQKTLVRTRSRISIDVELAACLKRARSILGITSWTQPANVHVPGT